MTQPEHQRQQKKSLKCSEGSEGHDVPSSVRVWLEETPSVSVTTTEYLPKSSLSGLLKVRLELWVTQPSYHCQGTAPTLINMSKPLYSWLSSLSLGPTTKFISCLHLFFNLLNDYFIQKMQTGEGAKLKSAVRSWSSNFCRVALICWYCVSFLKFCFVFAFFKFYKKLTEETNRFCNTFEVFHLEP